MSTPLFAATLAIFLMALSAKDFSFDRRSTLREACRSTLSGKLASLVSDLAYSEYYLKSLTDKIGTYSDRLKNYESSYYKLKAEAESKEFDVDLANQRDRFKHLMMDTRSIVSEFEKEIPEVKAKIKHLKTTISSGRESLSTIFNVEDLNITGGETTVEVNYKRSCPEYVYCTLNETERKHLKKIRLDGVLPQVCERYADVRLHDF